MSYPRRKKKVIEGQREDDTMIWKRFFFFRATRRRRMENTVLNIVLYEETFLEISSFLLLTRTMEGRDDKGEGNMHTKDIFEREDALS
jgi:hypothetical protein